jgi:hypothetical protein
MKPTGFVERYPTVQLAGCLQAAGVLSATYPPPKDASKPAQVCGVLSGAAPWSCNHAPADYWRRVIASAHAGGSPWTWGALDESRTQVAMPL